MFDIDAYLNSLSSKILQIKIVMQGITHIGDLRRFTNLREVYLSYNELTEIPWLPPSVRELDISYNRFTVMPSIVSCVQLYYLNCVGNNLITLGELPSEMTHLRCDRNQIVDIGVLPYKLQELSCSNNNLVKISELPLTLTQLLCSCNNLTEIPKLPENLKYLDCSSNQLEKLPKFNRVLQRIYCFRNRLTDLPPFNVNMTEVYCYDNNIARLPLLTRGIYRIMFFGNPIHDIINSDDMDVIRYQLMVWYNFRYLYHAIKCYRKKWHEILWKKIREPKAMMQCHPDILARSLGITEENEDCPIETEDLEKVMIEWSLY